MKMTRFNPYAFFIVMSCLCLFVVGFTEREIPFEAAMDFYEQKDFSAAFNIFNDLAEKDYDKAQFMLCKMYLNGEGTAKDDVTAFRWAEKAANKGNIEAQQKLATMYENGLGVSKDDTQAIYWYTKAADQGHADSQSRLGFYYYMGRIVPQDLKLSISWLSKAAGQEVMVAQWLLGTIYYYGTGVPADHTQAIFWLTKAAEQGHQPSQSYLAWMYFGNDSPIRDYKKALYWLGKIVDKKFIFEGELIPWSGLASIYNALGHIYSSGDDGVPIDKKKAFYWYEKSAGIGDNIAQSLLGYYYEQGIGVIQDYKQAIYWYTKAAEQGCAFAQGFLAFMHYGGKGVPQNYLNAYVWFNLAASQGDEIPTHYRDEIAKLLTPQQLASAQALAAEIQHKIDNPSSQETSSTPSASSTPEIAKQPEIKDSGTGFIITADGYLLTCFHVIEGAEKIEVAIGDERKTAKVITTDANTELALLKVAGEFDSLSFSSKRTLSMGEEVFTLGYPNPLMQGVNHKFTKGEISSLTGYKDDLRLYQISVPVQPGNSGGPLLDSYGNVCGLIVAMLDAETAFEISGSLPQNVNYAVKSAYVHALLDTLPDIAAKLSPPVTKKRSMEDIVKKAEKSIVMILVYK